MPETNDLISRLTNKNTSDVDSLLSYADGIKKGRKKTEQNADKILDELLNESDRKSRPDYDKDFRKITPAENYQNSRNFHRLLVHYDTPEYITYGSICDFSSENTRPVITDEAENSSVSELNKEADKDSSEKHSSESEISEDPVKINSSDITSGSEENISNAEKFISQQELKHPKFYFVFGLSIFIIAMLGLISCAYLGLNALRNFAEKYQTEASAVSSVSETVMHIPFTY